MNNELTSVWNSFISSVAKNKNLTDLYMKLDSGSATYKEAQEFSSSLSSYLVDWLAKEYPNDSKKVLDALRDTNICKNFYKKIDDYVYKAQKDMNVVNNLGMNAVKVIQPSQILDQDTTYTDDFKKDIETFANKAELSSNKHVDTIQQANAKFQSKAGFGVTVSRKYDGRGLSDGRSCKWCLERARSNVPYDQAVKSGMFQRHEGCHCMIEYNNNGEKTRQYSKGKNNWYQANEINSELSQRYKKVERTNEEQFSLRSKSVKNDIKAREIKGYNGVFVSNNALIKPKKLHEINKYNNNLIKEFGIKDKPNILIVTNEELNYNVDGLYVATSNTVVYPNDVVKGTQRHEMTHCKQADDFRKEYGEITKENYLEYLNSASSKAKERLEKKGLTVDKIKEYGKYFERMCDANRFDEVEAQLKNLEVDDGF